MNSPLWLTISQDAIDQSQGNAWDNSPLDLAARWQFGLSAGHACGTIYVAGQRRYLLPAQATVFLVAFFDDRPTFPTSFRLMPLDGEEAQA